MIIAVTGASSGIGNYLIHELEDLGHVVLKLSRNPVGKNDIYFDVDYPQKIRLECDLLIHLAWRYWQPGDPRDLNFVATSYLLDSIQKDTRVILLSTLSIFAPKSEYGREKKSVENQFLSRKGLVIRAGVLWGTKFSSGILNAVIKIANLPFICFHPAPDPILYLTHQRDVYSCVIEYLKSGNSGVATPNSKERITVVGLMHMIRDSRRLHLNFPIINAIWILKVLQKAKFKIPIRVDSLNGILNESETEIPTSSSSNPKESDTILEFHNWLTTVVKTK